MTQKKSPPPEPHKQTSIPNAASSEEESRTLDRYDEKPSDAIGATSGIPVVGIGGSAGALESFKSFLKAMPADSGAAFVVIQHLAPAHASLLTEILAGHTNMRVYEAQEGTPVEPNCVYIIPPGHYLGIRDGILYLSEPVTEHGIRMPVDFFFRSLAEDRQERAICILFSGAGSDGTLGVRAVRGTGGLVIAQDKTAQFGEMPRSAIATGLVDLVLQPDRMPKAIMEYLQQPYVRGGEPSAVLDAEGKSDGFNEILNLVRAQTDCDFRCYKKSTILRRIERRMGLHHVADISQYSDLLRQDPGEIEQLRKDLLINVTAFFRDAEAFEELRRIVIAPLVRDVPMDETLRVWVPGCSSGEEAYSVAMLLLEEVEAARKHCQVQVFATDIDDEALQFARTGIYPESIIADVGENHIARFFIRKPGYYHVNESLRGSVVFAAQNLTSDPPFSKMNLISCRNLLIYLDTAMQAKLIPLFNFALNPGGYLFLGKSESVGGQHALFDTVSKKSRIYRRLTPSRPIMLDSPILPGKKKTLPTGGIGESKLSSVSYGDSIRRALLNHFAASVVLVTPKGQVLQFHGQTGKYLNMPTGEPNLNLLEIAREGLSLKLRSALHQAASEDKAVVMENIQIMQSDGVAFVRTTVIPITQRGDAELQFAVIFEDVPRPLSIQAVPARGESETLVGQLENELRATQQDLQSSIQELQASNEELRVANEEVLSANEELQSTNEELETSKEELQSVNEELTTVNSQLQDKVEKLNTANRDIGNFIESTQIATLFLDSEQQIKLFTPATTQLLKVIPSDTGRPISDLSMPFIDYDLPSDARAVGREKTVIERDVRHTDGSSYLVRLMPYRAQDNEVGGVVVTFSDVTALRRADTQIRRLATAVMDSNDAVICFDMEGKVQAWNRGAGNMYGWNESEALRLSFGDLVPACKAAEFRDMILRLQAGEVIASFETQRLTKDRRTLDVWLTITAVMSTSQKVVMIATTERDITERKRQGEAILRAKNEWERTFDQVPDLIAILDNKHHIVRANRAMAERLGVKPEQCVGLTCYKAVHGTDEPPEFCPHARTLLEGGEQATEVHEDRLGGDFIVTTTPLLSPDGKVEGTIHVAREITQRKQAEEALRNLNVNLEQRVQERTLQLRALALELAQAEERERKRLAQVLHDHLQQLLVAAKFGVTAIRNKVTPVIQPDVQEVLNLIGLSIDVSRSLTMELSPPILHEGGLAAGLTWLARWTQEKYGITINVNTDGVLPPMSEDLRLMCFQAVRELVLNMVKYAGVTSAQITMTHDEGRSLRIVVSDKGKGFDTTQAVGATSGSFGLFSIRERFALLGGSLEVESAPGQGTRATLTVPLLYSDSLKLKESVSPLVEKEISSISASGMIRVLVADDHTLFRKGLVGLLQKQAGFSVVGEAVNGLQTVEQARLLKPDVVLMDVTMPEMNGIDATRLILSELPDVRVIGLSMHVDEMAGLMRAAGAVRYFAKDGHIEDLVDSIRKVCLRQDHNV